MKYFNKFKESLIDQYVRFLLKWIKYFAKYSIITWTKLSLNGGYKQHFDIVLIDIIHGYEKLVVMNLGKQLVIVFMIIFPLLVNHNHDLSTFEIMNKWANSTLTIYYLLKYFYLSFSVMNWTKQTVLICNCNGVSLSQSLSFNLLSFFWFYYNFIKIISSLYTILICSR